MITSTRTSSPLTTRKILLVDDHPIVRQGLASVLRQEMDLEVYEGPDNVADALEQIRQIQPDLVVVDISLNESTGTELIAQARGSGERTRFLVWSTFEDELFADRVLRAGAKGYVNKREPLSTVLEAITCILHGKIYLSPRMTNRILDRVGGGPAIDKDPVAQLSGREAEVFRWIGRGAATQEIARQLGVATKTVEAHRENIKKKLHLKSAAELNRRAVQCEWEHGISSGNGQG